MHYGTANAADAYFQTRLHAAPWFGATLSDQVKALHMATRQIDRLNFRGAKVDSAQELEFPRVIDEVAQAAVPEDIEIATYEIALRLLDGVDVEAEVERAGQQSQSYASVRTTHREGDVPAYIAAGVVSFIAWQRLVPYLRDTSTFNLVRAS